MKYLGVILLFISSFSYAGAWSTPATPTRIDVERGNGFMVYGQFGNAMDCTASDKVYVKFDHPQYKEIYSTVLSAYMSGKKIQPYINECSPVAWYSVSTTTYNTLTSGGSLSIMD